LDAPNSSKCPNCGLPKMPHRICPDCGYYNGKLIIAKKVKKSKQEQETKEEGK
jgi:large subunit ribosomal protein L32